MLMWAALIRLSRLLKKDKEKKRGREAGSEGDGVGCRESWGHECGMDVATVGCTHV